MQTTYYETRNEADTVGSAHVTTQYNDSVTEGNLGDDDWPDQISRICETDNGGDDDDPPLIGTCADPNDSGYGQTECVGCNDGYEDNSDGLGCVEIQDNDDDDDNGEDSNNLKWIGYGAAGASLTPFSYVEASSYARWRSLLCLLSRERPSRRTPWAPPAPI